MKQLMCTSLSSHAVTKFQNSITSKPCLIFLSVFFSSCRYSPGPFMLFWRKKVSFDFAVALYSIDAPDIPKNFAK